MSDDLLRELGKELPWDRPDAARRDAVRSSLLVRAAEGEPRSSRRRWLPLGAAFAAGALAAAAAAIVLAPRAPDPSWPAGAAQITTSSGARLEHGMVATSTGIDEIVRVRDGAVRVVVDGVRSGDHVRVHAGDARVEGTGEYEVTVVADALAAVTVRTGSAEIEVRGQRPVFLAAGQTWRASIATTELLAKEPAAVAAAPAPVPAPTPAPGTASVVAIAPDAVAPTPRSAAPARPDVRVAAVRIPDEQPAERRHADVRSADGPKPSPPQPASPPEPSLAATSTPPVTAVTADPPNPPVRKPSETERRFQAGWALLREGKALEAARELGVAADAGGGDPLAADARYFQAVAFVRAGQGRDAERALIAFLDRAPRSLRRGRAVVLLATLIAERGDVPSARAWFQSAEDDPDPSVAAAARAGLAKLGARP
jgi:hypothetical protein